MDKLKIAPKNGANKTVARTIRISGSAYDKIEEVAEKNNTTFNSIANQLIEYSLKELSKD